MKFISRVEKDICISNYIVIYNIFQFGYVKGDGDVDVTMAELVPDEQIDNVRVLYAYITIFISVNYNFSL